MTQPVLSLSWQQTNIFSAHDKEVERKELIQMKCVQKFKLDAYMILVASAYVRAVSLIV